MDTNRQYLTFVFMKDIVGQVELNITWMKIINHSLSTLIRFVLQAQVRR